ncbi:DNA mismatch repair protein MutL [Izhakiella australiensis]|uniref:DNA mismatch repair protein MutL n=1 Tax=Izhakiella australiensis TaxID=1926881 RepID=A0A1S8YSG2_9GAMM|nr:DNA mismatch repair endonuclease MutL [Izhakiella australiensis]OON41788.1 DNA mismatch repair protein MutL [Izhakiella australiensis]
MPIQVLPPQLANQIAAGEVVERPASVVKELVENSLDAGATRIDIDIEKGGAKLIRIRDNGGGIGKEELTMALARHATSKISSLDDLEAILSLGFRGEALASISSVSRLTLTSRPEDQREAWSAYAEGRDMVVTVKPAAHPPGTTLEVLDLFFNTPARRKFMRTEKTEFAHIDEVVRRIALARFDVAISLTHNGKLVRQYRGVNDPGQHERRLGAICGTAFLSHALAVEWQHGDLNLRGWVADPAGARAVTEMQYCYVNGRMMRDRLINHAIRQAYQDKLGAEHQPAYVLYLDIDPHQVDVNVHPAKHEVRFHQSRMVHDFIYQGVVSVIQESGSPTLPIQEPDDDGVLPDTRWQPTNRPAAGGNHFATPAAPTAVSAGEAAGRQPGWQPQQEGYRKREGAVYQKLLQAAPLPAREPVPAVNITANSAPEPVVPLQGHNQSFGRLLTVLSGVWALLEHNGALRLMSLAVAGRWLKQAQLDPANAALKAQPLLIPVRLKLEKAERNVVVQRSELLQHFGLDLMSDGQHVTLRAVPLPLRNQNLQILIPELLGYLASRPEVTADQIVQWLARHAANESQQWNHSQAITLLTEVERLCPQLVKSPPAGLIQPIDIETAVSALKHD